MEGGLSHSGLRICARHRLRSVRRFALSPIVVAALAWATAAEAGHHRWDFSELFTNADGSVQYIELFSANATEAGPGPWTITSGQKTLDLDGGLPSAGTDGTFVLIATASFVSLPGAVTPDYILPARFFSAQGGSLTADGAAVWKYPAVPTDGVNALQRGGSWATNSPTNLGGTRGSVKLGPSRSAAAAWAVVLSIGALLLASHEVLRRRRA